MLAENPKRIKQKYFRLITFSDFSCHTRQDFFELYYKAVFGKKLDLNNPRTFNEKLQWLKLYDRNPGYTKLVDKYEVKSL